MPTEKDNEMQVFKTNRIKEGLAPVSKMTKEFSETMFVGLFIINGVAATLFLFDILSASELVKELSGAILFAYVFVAFMTMMHRGVKQSTNTKRKK